MEDAQVARFTREIRAMGKAADLGPRILRQGGRTAAELDRVIRNAAVDLNGQGFSWADIAAPLGIGRNAAHKRYAGTD
jgi:hypothetical protein